MFAPNEQREEMYFSFIYVFFLVFICIPEWSKTYNLEEEEEKIATRQYYRVGQNKLPPGQRWEGWEDDVVAVDDGRVDLVERAHAADVDVVTEG